MAFTIPNESAAPANAAQSTVYQTDVDILVQALGGDGVVSGAAVTAQGSPDNTVAVASGVIRVGGVEVTVTSGNVTMPTADGSNPMWVLISVSSSGTKTATAGTAAAAPLLPALPANHVALAAVWWPASDTTVASSQITDKRTFPSLAGPPLLEKITTDGTNSSYAIPGQGGTQVSTRTVINTRTFYEPFFTPERISISDLALEVTASASGTMRVGLYNADANWQPTSLVADWGTVDTGSTGVKTISPGAATVIPRGRYLVALSGSGSPTLRCIRSVSLIGIGNALGGSPFWALPFYASGGGGGALPDPGDDWNDSVDAGNGQEHCVVLRYT